MSRAGLCRLSSTWKRSAVDGLSPKGERSNIAPMNVQSLPRPIDHLHDLAQQILFSMPLPPMEERLLLRLCYLANSSGNVRAVTIRDLAWYMHCSERSVKSALGALEAPGLITRSRPRHPQRQESSTYEIDVKAMKELAGGYWRERTSALGYRENPLLSHKSHRASARRGKPFSEA